MQTPSLVGSNPKTSPFARCTTPLLVFSGMFLALVFSATTATATPVYAVRSINACDTCHIEPLGWNNPKVEDRFCTLDCNGCHVSPTGGGMRTGYGLYYGKEVLPTFGERPSSHANPEKYLPEGYPKKGRYRLGEGFSGWWAGSTPHTEIPERLGDIDPNPKFQIGADIRFMNLFPIGDEERDNAFFPMQTDIYLMGRPLDQLVLYVNAGLRGYKEDREDLTAIDYLIVREAFVKVDRLKNNSYARLGRFNPAYGWRMPDHTTFTRRDLGFGENRQVYGLEASTNPNYLYVNAAAFYQGIDGFPGDQEPPGFGATANVGWRDLGYHVGASLHYLNRAEGEGGFDDVTAGVNWAVNFYPFVYLGQVDMRYQLAADAVNPDGSAADNVLGLFAYHEIDALIYRGVNAKIKYDWLDASTQFKDDQVHRVTAGLEWHPYTYTHIETQYRRTYADGNNPLVDVADVAAQEMLVILHAWF